MKDKINSTIADIFGHGTVEYQKYKIWELDTLPHIVGERNPLHEVRQGYEKGISNAIIKLKSLQDILQEKLQDIEGEIVSDIEPMESSITTDSRKVFVVHGHDEAIKQKVARFVEKLELKPIILHEKPNEGRTVIEKFERDASQVTFAVILLTPDDIGFPRKKPDEKRARARQNVVLELGYFSGILGRQNVCVLHKGDVEIPSDYLGVVYIEMDEAGAWRFKLSRELKQSGLPVDLNNLV